jgi:hypothetical protein
MANADQLAVKPEVTPESPEYIEQMASKGAEAVNSGNSHAEEPAPEPVAPKPEGIPDKFYNAETGVVDYAALAKSYSELEKKASGKTTEPPKEEPVKNPAETTEEQAAEAVEKAGLDFQALSQEFNTKGSLSDDTYAALEKSGLPRDIVDAYIDGRMAAAEVAKTQAYAVTEGADGYKAMIEWAKANASPEEIAAYNKSVNSRNASERDLAVRGMWSRYASESGTSGANLVTGKTVTSQNTGGYASRAEMMRDMDDPRYKADPAFRKTVETKLAKSDIF